MTFGPVEDSRPDIELRNPLDAVMQTAGTNLVPARGNHARGELQE
jgi:hypothetical protein